jgi:hypothetical protein
MKKPSPKTVKLILTASLKNEDFLKNLIYDELYYLHTLNIYQIKSFGFSIEESIKLSLEIHIYFNLSKELL